MEMTCRDGDDHQRHGDIAARKSLFRCSSEVHPLEPFTWYLWLTGIANSEHVIIKVYTKWKMLESQIGHPI